MEWRPAALAAKIARDRINELAQIPTCRPRPSFRRRSRRTTRWCMWGAATGWHGLDPARLAVAGDSVGGQHDRGRHADGTRARQAWHPAAAAVLPSDRRVLRHRVLPPVCDRVLPAPRRHEVVLGPVYERPGRASEVTASPLRATTEQLRGLPPALVITAAADVLRDEGEAYASRLREAGVRVMAARFQGTIHDFVRVNALANTAAARGAIAIAWWREGFSGRC